MFKLSPLPYAYDALEPYIDAGTMSSIIQSIIKDILII